MPSCYTHHIYSEQVLHALPKQYREIIQRHKELFAWGAEGPDLFFFFMPGFYMNPVCKLGFQMHRRPGQDFFQSAAKVLREDGFPEAELSYLYGFLTHFVLDRICHEKIYRAVEKGVASHNEIETEVDRALLVKEGKDPITASRVGFLENQKEYAELISRFFPFPASAVKISMDSAIRDRRLITTSSRKKRKALYGLMKFCHVYDWMHGVIVNRLPSRDCAGTTQMLLHTMSDAGPTAVSLIRDFQSTAEGKNPWAPFYQDDFCGNYYRK